MKVILTDVSKGPAGENLPATSLEFESGAVTLAVVETAKRPTVLALLAAGRMVPDAGSITLDGEVDSAALRARTAIIDAPDVSEPVADLKLTVVVREELMFAARPSSREATRAALDELDAAEYAGFGLQNVPPAVRLRILAELAASRPGIDGLVLTSPDRHGGDPFEWWEVASGLARRGFAVLVIASEASVTVLRDAAESFEADRRADLERQAAARRSEELASAEAAALSDVATPDHGGAHAASVHPSTPEQSTATGIPATGTPAAATLAAPQKDLA